MPGACFVGVAEVDCRHRGVDPENLILDALASLDGEAEQFLDLGWGCFALRVDEFHQAGECLVDAVAVSRGDVRAESEVLLVSIGVIGATHGPQHLGDVVDDETVAGGEHLAADGVHLPAGDVEVQPVEVGGVVIGLGQFVEEVGVFEHVGHVVRGVAHEHHRRFGPEGLDAPGERLVRHVVLHDVDQRLVGALPLAGELVEGNHIPVADQPDAAVGVVDEEFRDGDLSAGDQHAVGRELGVDVGLACALRPELDEVVVALDERDKADEL